MDALELAWSTFQQHRPLAARLAVLTCLPVRVTPALVRLARITLLPEASTDAEADLWLSDLVEARASAGFLYHPAVRGLLRRQLCAEPGLLDAVWHEVHLKQAQWLLPRIQLEEELTWRLLRDPADREIEERWRGVVSDLDCTPHAEGLAHWIVRAMVDLPAGSLTCESGRRAFHGAHILLGDASVLGHVAQRFHDTDHFAFATRRLPRQTVFVGLSEHGVLIDPVQPIKNGHAVEVPATQPMWLQIEPIASSEAPMVIIFDGHQAVQREISGAPLRLRLLDGSAYELHPQDSSRPTQVKPSPFPRVELSYDVEVNGKPNHEKLPFTIWVLGDFLGSTSSMSNELQSVPVKTDGITNLMQIYRPSLHLGLSSGDGRVDGIGFASIDDFSPAALMRHVPALRSLTSLREHVVFLEKGASRNEALGRYIGDILRTTHLLEAYASYASDPSLRGIRYQKRVLLDILQESTPRPSRDQEQQYFQAIVAIADHIVSRPTGASGRDGFSLRAIAGSINSSLARLLDGVVRHPGFRQLEASWLGLGHLMAQAPSDRNVQMRVLSMKKGELLAALSSDGTSDPFDSPMFRILQHSPGAASPSFGCLIGDFYFDETAADLELLGKMASFCAVAHMPFIAGARYGSALTTHDDKGDVFATTEIPGVPEDNRVWRNLRARPESRYIVLTTPRFMARRPLKIKLGLDFEFDEKTENRVDTNYVWANTAYLLAINIGRSFDRYGWFAKLTGTGADTSISGLPVDNAERSPSAATHGVCEASLSSRMAEKLNARGFMAVIQQRVPGTVAFSEAVSICDMNSVDRSLASASTLPYLFALCGFAHCIQRMVESKFSWGSPDRLDAAINEWLAMYVSNARDLSEESRARFPLGSAEFRTKKAEPDDSRYEGTLFALPRFQLHELSRRISIQIMIPKSKFT